MKALTISQPFAELIANGDKFVENRSWPTRYRGPLAIHAGKGKQYLSAKDLADYDTGAIVAVGELAACFELAELERDLSYGGPPKSAVHRRGILSHGKWFSAQEIVEHEHTEGPWCWVLTNVKRVDPFPINGKQGLWNPPEEFIAKECNHVDRDRG